MEENYTKMTVTNIFTGETKEITTILQGFTLTENANDTMDSGTIIFLDADKKPLTPYSLIKIPYRPLNENSEYRELCVLQDNPVLRCKLPNKIDYKHTVSLIEKTAILERIPVQNLMLTNENDTLLTQLEKACVNVLQAESEPVFGSNSAIRLTLSEELKAFVGDRQGEDFGFNDTNLKVILEEMLSPLGVYPVVEEFVVGSELEALKIVISYKNPNDIVKEDTFEQVISEESTNDMRDFGGKISTFVTNAIPKTNCIEKDVKPKSQTIEQNTDNLFLSVTHPIEDLVKVKVRINGTIEVLGYGDVWEDDKEWETHYSYAFNITNIFVDSELYELLPADKRKNTIPYIRGEKSIDLNRKVKKLFTTVDEIKKAILEELKDQIVKEQSAIFEQCGDEILPYSGEYGAGEKRISIYFQLEQSRFEIEYKPRLDYICEIHKPNCHNGKVALLGIPDGQSASSPDTERTATALLGKITRIGNDLVYVDDKVYHYSDLKPLKTRIDGKSIIYQRDLSIFDNFIKVRYYLAEGYNNYSARVGISREKRIYNIPLVGENCIIKAKTYVYIGKKMLDFGENRFYTRLHTRALLKIGNALLGKSSGEIVDRMFITTRQANGEVIGSFELPTVAYGGGNTFGFKSSFLDNYSSGYSFDAPEHKLVKKKYISFNPYCDEENGEFGKLSFTLKSGRATNTDEVINALPKSNENYYSADNLISKEISIDYYKDRMQAISVQSDFVLMNDRGEEDEIIIGEKLSIHNGLVAPGLKNIRLYLSDELYSRNEIFKVKGNEDALQFKLTNAFTIEGSGYVVKITFTGFTRNCKAWAIGDKDGNLLVAVNSKLMQGSTLYLSSDRVLV